MRCVAGPGLRLEPQVAEHADEMFRVLGDPLIHAFENAPPPSVEWLRWRFERLQARCSPDGQEQWLNWVIRLPTGALIGYVQATVDADGRATIGYELASAHWGLGLGRAAVQAMIGELAAWHGVRHLAAVLKRGNERSRRLLARLGFTPAVPEAHTAHEVAPDEWLMLRTLA